MSKPKSMKQGRVPEEAGWFLVSRNRHGSDGHHTGLLVPD